MRLSAAKLLKSSRADWQLRWLVQRALEIISEVRKQGVAVLLIEHNMRAVMSICDRLVVLNFGEEIARGSPDEVKKNRQVIEAYLGIGEHAA